MKWIDKKNIFNCSKYEFNVSEKCTKDTYTELKTMDLKDVL